MLCGKRLYGNSLVEVECGLQGLIVGDAATHHHIGNRVFLAIGIDSRDTLNAVFFLDLIQTIEQEHELVLGYPRLRDLFLDEVGAELLN